MKVYGAYGSNMNWEQMAKRCPKSKRIGVGVLKDYKLSFRGKGHGDIKAYKGYEVPIVLWEITPGCEETLDKYETYPDYYKKEEVLVETETGSKKVMVYIMTEDHEDLVQKPATEYYNTIYRGYKDNGISVSVLQRAYTENEII